MNKWKSFTLLFIILIALIGAACLVNRLLQPRPSEIERVFDGTEAVFIESRGLLAAWRTLSQTDYWKSGTYKGLLELPPVTKALDTTHTADGNWIDRLNLDAVMSAVGDESALGVYTEGGSSRLLFVSRVDPNFLLLDRMLAFAGSQAGITVVQYRTMRVKEAALEKGRSLLWALDGDFLIVSDNKDVFYAAVDRHIDGTTGGIASNRDFRRMKRNDEPSLIISGYAVTERLVAIPKTRGLFSDTIWKLMPGSLRFRISYANGVAALDVEGIRNINPFSLFSGNRRRAIPPLPDNEIAAAWVGRMPLSSPDTSFPSVPAGPLPGLLPSLFPDGFSVFVLSDPRGTGEPGMIAVGEHSISWVTTVARLKETSGLIERGETTAGVNLSILDNGGVPYLAWTERTGRMIVSGRPDLLVEMPLETLEMSNGFGYNGADGEISLSIRPRLMYREIERSTKPIPISFTDFSLDQERRLAAALYAAEYVDGYASIAGNGLKIDIGIHVEDVIP
jgi:hypothetical protein